MTSKSDSQLNPYLYPYMFVLRAGEDIKTDMMDFSLSIWHLTCQERLPRSKTVAPFLEKTKAQTTRAKRSKN